RRGKPPPAPAEYLPALSLATASAAAPAPPYATAPARTPDTSSAASPPQKRRAAGRSARPTDTRGRGRPVRRPPRTSPAAHTLPPGRLRAPGGSRPLSWGRRKVAGR